MKYGAVFNREFTCEYWTYVINLDSVGTQTRKYSKDSDMSVVVAGTGVGSTLALFSEVALQKDAQLRNLRDPEGTPVYDDTHYGYVGIGEPVFNPWGVITGYQYALNRGPAV